MNQWREQMKARTHKFAVNVLFVKTVPDRTDRAIFAKASRTATDNERADGKKRKGGKNGRRNGRRENRKVGEQ